MMALATAVALAMATASGPPPLRCGGPYVPPTDYDGAGNPVVLEFAVVSGGPGTSRDAVGSEARRALVSRLCRMTDPAYCGPLEIKAKLWAFGEDARGVCAMAVISSLDLEAWRTLLAPDLDGELRKALTQLFPDEDGDKPKKSLLGFGNKSRRRSAAVLIDRIDDSGTAGGLRADWLLGRVRAALTAIDVDMVEPQRGFTGRFFPKNVDFSLRGTLVDRRDPRTQLPIFDVDFTLTDKKGFARNSRPFSISAALAPAPPRKLPPPPPPIGLTLHVESQRGGSLCPGDYTQIHLTNETNEPLFVRVINLDQAGEAIVLFPNEARTDDIVPPNTTISLSPDGFSVEGGANGRERYVAIGALTREGLGRFRDARGTCRYAPGDAAYLNGEGSVDAPYRASAGFTLLDDVRCRKPIAMPDSKLLASLLADVRVCPALER